MLARIPRSRGMLSGLLLVLLGAWGGLIPFIGPYFHFAYTPGHPWVYTTGRFWLEILPAAVTVIGGLIMLMTASRPLAHFGGLLAAAAGAWFVMGGLAGPVWTATGWTGVPEGGPLHQAAEQFAFFYGLGAAILFIAGLAIGRCAVIGVRESRAYPAPRHERTAAESTPEPADTAEPREPVHSGRVPA